MEQWHIDRDEPGEIADFIRDFATSSGGQRLICFDYFDTIVTRIVVPEHTKNIASAALSQLLGGVFSGNELYQIRRDLERAITEQNARQTGELDFCLADFGLRFWLSLQERQTNFTALDQQQFVASLLALEVAVEKAVQEVCPQVLKVLQDLQGQGLPLVLVSDFYLSEACFVDVLKALGLDSFFPQVYVSSSRGKSKGAGTIYPQIAHDFQCSPEQMLMIGDNPHADIAMARQFGMPTLQVLRPILNPLSASSRQEGGDGKNGLAANLKNLPLQGHFSEMACSLWLFTHRLFQELWQNGRRDVFFLSKEGEFLQKLFSTYQLEIFGAEKIRSHYLLASRKATFLPSLRPLDQEDFLRLFAHYRDISIRDFLLSLNFETLWVDRLCRQRAFDCSERIFDLRNRPEFHDLISLPLFRQEYEKRRAEQRSRFIDYLRSFKVDYGKDGLCLVDVGWKGSIQDNIYHILDRAVQIQGYFIGSYHATERYENNRKKGLLFDNSGQLGPYYNVYNNNRSLYEMLLGATHGSADCYIAARDFDKDSVHAHLAISARREADAGELLVLVLDLPEERKLFDTTIRPLQDAMLRTFSCLDRAYLLAGCTAPDEEWFARRHARMVFTPHKEEVDFFAALYHLENFGIFEYTDFQTANRLTWRQRLRNLRNVLRDPAVLESVIWPPIILRRLGL